MSITSRIETANADVKTIEVPEWKLDGEPLKIHFSPMTLRDNKKISQRHPNFLENIMDGDVQVHIIINKAIDDKGDALFTYGDKNWFDRQDPLVVLRVASSIVQGKTVEELEKN